MASGPTYIGKVRIVTMRAIAYARVSTEQQATDDKTSLSEQLLAVRKYAESHGYEIVEEIAEEMSGRRQDTEGLEKIRDAADSGRIAAVLVYKWNRLARTVARFESLMLEMKLAGVDIVSLDGQSNATATGRMFNRLMAVFSEYQRDDLVETMQQGKRGLARQGRIVPSRFAPYGFEYDREMRAYRVDEERMETVRALFRMVGAEGQALWAVKRAFDAAGVPTTKGAPHWHTTTFRDMIFNDAYRPHTPEELRAMVEAGNLAPDVLAGLDAGRSPGIAWYNRHKVETTPDGRQIKMPKPREEWIAVPVSESGIPREWVEAARERIRDNVKPSDAGYRSWNLKPFGYCECGARLKPHTVRRPTGLHFYYVCAAHRRGKAPCPHAKYHPAVDTEERVSGFVLRLIEDPDVLREQVEAQAAREKDGLRDTRRRIGALAQRLAEADAERDRYNRLYARGKLSDAEYDAYTAELDARKATTEEELGRLGDARRHVEHLDRLPALVEEYLRDLPYLMGREPVIRDYELVGHDYEPGAPPRTLTPDSIRHLTQEELAEKRRGAEAQRSERFGWLYGALGLRVVAHKGGTLEVSWGGGVCKLEDLPTTIRARTRGTTPSCSKA